MDTFTFNEDIPKIYYIEHDDGYKVFQAVDNKLNAIMKVSSLDMIESSFTHKIELISLSSLGD